jgi:hypothetical protein
VDENEFGRIEIGLALEPVPAPAQDVGPRLFGCVHRLFFHVMPRQAKKNRHSVLTATTSPALASSGLDLRRDGTEGA